MSTPATQTVQVVHSIMLSLPVSVSAGDGEFVDVFLYNAAKRWLGSWFGFGRPAASVEGAQ